MEKLEVYFNEYNVLMNNAVYLPLVSGRLQAYAQTKSAINENYQFMPFIFFRDRVENILEKYKNPSVAAFSISMWNSNLSLNVAKKVREKFPNCLIVFGGFDVPNHAEKYMADHDFIDVAVRGEGEKTFVQVLEKNISGKDFVEVPGITYRNESGEIIRNNEEQILEKDLDIFPSPYLEGVFDEIINIEDINFQAIVETNRGCPFGCSYCSWGQGGLSEKFRHFSSERVRAIANWCGENQIGYVFCADSNFGMFPEDLQTAQFFVDANKKYNFPEKFRVCYSKNVEDNVFQIGSLLHANQMEKSITLSLQTANPEAAENVRRKNISMDVFNNLQKRYNYAGIPTYTELILGLPGETYESFLKGIEDCLQSGIENQLFSYHCQIYPNAEMGDEEYRKKFKIKTIKCPLKEVHAVPREKGVPEEYEDVIIETYSMPEADWEKASVVSWVMQFLHGLKVGFYPIKHIVEKYNVKYTDFFDYILNLENLEEFPMFKKEMSGFWDIVRGVAQGEARCRVVPEFSPIYWEPEEESFLNISHDKSKFYDEFYRIIIKFLEQKSIDFDKDELMKIIEYQKSRMPDYDSDFDGNKEKFAKEILLWGRKSGKILRPE